MLQEADVAAVSWQVRLAVLKDAKLDVSQAPRPAWLRGARRAGDSS